MGMAAEPVDLDSVKWWFDFAHKCITSFGVIGLGIWHWILWLKDKEEAINWVEHHVERRHKVTISEIVQDAEMLKQVLPELEALYAAGQALFTKVEAIKTAQAQSAGAPPAGQV